MKNLIRKNKYVINGFGYLGTAGVFATLCGIASMYIFANYVEKSLFGQYQYVLSLIGVFSLLSLRGVRFEIVKKIVAGNTNALISGVAHYLKFSLVASAIALLVAGYYFLNGDTTLAAAVALVAILFPVFKSFPFYDAIFIAKKNFKRKAMYGSLYSIIPAVIIGINALWATGLIQLVGVYLLANILVSGLLFFTVLKKYNIADFSITPFDNPRATFHNSFHLTLYDFEKMIHRFYIFYTLGGVALASFVIAYLPVRETFRVKEIAQIISLPKIAERGYLESKSILLKKTAQLFILMSLASVAYWILCPYLYTIVFPDYIDVIMISQILAIQIPFTSIVLIQNSLITFQRNRLLYVINIISLITRITLLVVLTFNFGLLGAAIAVTTAYILRFLMTVVFFILDPGA